MPMKRYHTVSCQRASERDRKFYQKTGGVKVVSNSNKMCSFNQDNMK